MIVVDVIGTPAPQGSKRHVGRGILVESSSKVRPWREAVVTALTDAGHAGTRLDSPVHVRVVFRLPRPAGHYGSLGIRRRHRLEAPAKRPDLDKLLRSTLDAVTTAAVIADDSRVVRVSALKRYVDEGEPPGCLLTIAPLEETHVDRV